MTNPGEFPQTSGCKTRLPVGSLHPVNHCVLPCLLQCAALCAVAEMLTSIAERMATWTCVPCCRPDVGCLCSAHCTC